MPLIPVANDQIATIVTSLEMREKPRPRPAPPSILSLARWTAPASERYRTLFRRVGAPWLWFSRLVMADADLRRILDDPKVEIYAATDRAGIELGMIELDFRVEGACELSYFALVPELTGKGHGTWLMAHALTLAWRKGVERVWVHTCTLDHPAALGFYRRHGFIAYKRTVETFADPRIAGLLPADVAPQIPCLGSLKR
ncbi:GNAT family N-acetyltransferase [Sphingomonas sp. M1-B02]|uniref:GNAT family N-acetyltransferase n=1 Tax=Sphingomonas sp. M1-B02 TaxID=3114300 RepID=UPI00224071F6|nr:GNAT family N-acetyltransferase [Sphingomonas sp. S6-11]UZK66032.1 GNAT family N-acetyltransferase [Sphingomonas sp. S6-11]